MSPAGIIRGYSQNQQGGAALVTIDDAPLGLPPIDPKREYRHSPDGFQWGYAGSGPAELARAILIASCPEDEAVARSPRCYQRFKGAVIAKLPQEGWSIFVAEVRHWMETFKASEASAADGIADIIEESMTGLPEAEQARRHDAAARVIADRQSRPPAPHQEAGGQDSC